MATMDTNPGQEQRGQLAAGTDVDSLELLEELDTSLAPESEPAASEEPEEDAPELRADVEESVE